MQVTVEELTADCICWFRQTVATKCVVMAPVSALTEAAILRLLDVTQAHHTALLALVARSFLAAAIVVQLLLSLFQFRVEHFYPVQLSLKLAVDWEQVGLLVKVKGLLADLG